MKAQGPQPVGRPVAGGLIKAGVVAVAAGAMVAAGVLLPGYDVRATPVDNAFVWVLRTDAPKAYARVNTELGEIDTVKKALNPSQLVQTATQALVFTDGGTRYAPINPVAPVDIDAAVQESMQSTPEGTDTVVAGGDYVAYLTDAGTVLAGEAGAPTVPFNPYDGQKTADGAPRQFVAKAVAVDASGRLYAYSAADRVVVTGSAIDGTVRSQEEVRVEPTGEPQLTGVNGKWALFDQAGGLQLSGMDGVVQTDAVDPAGALVQQPATTGDAVLIADSAGLLRVPLSGGAPIRDAGERGLTLGRPTAPVQLGQTSYAAWLPAGSASGTLWSSDGGTRTLNYANKPIGSNPVPTFESNGSRSVLNDTASGWVWTLPDGALVPSSQEWLDNEDPNAEEPEEQKEQEAKQPKPPVAVSDAFGVRAGRQVVLPVLLNDYDPNSGEVLTIDPASLSGLPESFGTVRTAATNQELVVSVNPGATGSATFRYTVTDGTTAEGLTSGPATVALTVYPDSENKAPVWCTEAVKGCLHKWPEASVSAGGTVTANVVTGWVDPEGDPIYLKAAASQGLGAVIAQPEGTVVYQAPKSVEGQLTSSIQVTVADEAGATSAGKTLSVKVAAAQLVAENFAVVGTVGEPVTVHPLAHVSGATGVARLTTAKTADPNSDARVTQNTNAGTFVLTANAPGSYDVNYTVSDTLTQTFGSVRVTVQDPDKAVLSVAPATAFVYANQDTTVDLLSTVQNPAGLALMVTDVVAQPALEAALDPSPLGQGQLRVTGSTKSGGPGLLGTVTYTVTDGASENPTTAEGQLTVIMVDVALPQAPIAVDDAVTTRAGVQVNIPVLANDTAPPGLGIVLDPSRVSYNPEAGLAFASGNQLRYLAPDKPGDYLVSYYAYAVGYPTLASRAEVKITVLGNDAISAPQPPVLSAWVLAGKSVAIPFNPYAVDPNGDAVVLDKVLEQPATGTANLSADGKSIVYTSTPGFAGQTSFQYQVRNSSGATGASVVRVGVLSDQSDPSPVTYTDYVQVGKGAANTVVVQPTANDIDPAGSTLVITEDGVQPSADAGSDRFTSLQRMIGAVKDNRVTLSSSDQLGVYPFTYTVRNDRGDQGIGLIVLRVVEGDVADYPVVADTILTADEADSFPRGIDVLSEKVAWTGGDAGGLELSLYREQPGVAVSGSSISGSQRDTAQLIPFKVDGTSFQGKSVTSYGFLQVPAKQPEKVILALKAGIKPKEVNEDGDISWDIAQDLTVPAGQTLEVDKDSVKPGGVRKAADCKLTGGTTLRYDAGAGAPWADVCSVAVRLSGQTDWTRLAVPIVVIAKESVPTLSSGSLTVIPSQDGVFDLRQLTTWSGDPEWDDVTYRADCPDCGDAKSGKAFQRPELGNDGHTLNVHANDSARPGTQMRVKISLTGKAKTAPSTLILKVGPAPGGNPIAGTVTKECSASGGATSCTFRVIAPAPGVSNQVNTIPTTPLKLVEVTKPATSCAQVEFAVANVNDVTASWKEKDAPGGDCIGLFVVEDAQGRQSLMGNVGEIQFRLNGLPAAPQAAGQVDYGDKSVTLEVTPAPGASVPPVDGYNVYDDANKKVTTCDAKGRCPAFGVAANNTKYSFTVKAFNSVGESLKSAAANGVWAYKKLTVGKVFAQAPYDPSTTRYKSVTVVLTFTVADSEVSSYLVKDENGASVGSSSGGGVNETKTVLINNVTPNQNHTYTVIPQFTGDLGAPTGNTVKPETSQASITPAGAPGGGSIAIVGAEANVLTAKLSDADANGGDGLSVMYIVYPKATTASSSWCQANSSGSMIYPSGAGISATSDSPRIGNLEENKSFNVVACVSNGYGAVLSSPASAFTFDKAVATNSIRDQVTQPGYGYTIGAGVSSDSGGTYNWEVDKAARLPTLTGVYADLMPQVELVSVTPGTVPTVTVKYCDRDKNRCTDAIRLSAADASAIMPQSVKANVAKDTCVASNTGVVYTLPGPEGLLTWGGGVPASASYYGNVTYTLPNGSTVSRLPGDPVPGESTDVHAVKFAAKVDFWFTGADHQGLRPSPVRVNVSGTCEWRAKDKVKTTVELTITPDDSGQRTSAEITTANPVVIGVRVSSTAGTPGGKVTLDDDGTTIGGGSKTLDSDGTASFRLTSLSAGTHKFKVTYRPESSADKDSYDESSATKTYEVKTVVRSTSIAVLTYTPSNPSPDAEIKVTVAVTASGTGTSPKGTVTVHDGDRDAPELVDPVTLNSTGQATVRFTLPAGEHYLYFVFHPSAGFAESSSQEPITLIVG